MITRGIFLTILIVASALFFITACDVMSDTKLDESLRPVPNVTLIEGAENVNIRANKGSDSYFNIDIQNVEWNNLISNGERDAWCIAYNTPISANNDVYEGLGIYSTKGDAQFASVNRLFSIKNDLMKNDQEITWREIQVAIWSLLEYPKFDMYDTAKLPDDMKQNGQPLFNSTKVEAIISAVESTATTKLTASSTTDSYEKTVCVIATDKEDQTLIVECDETAYAYGGNNMLNNLGQAGFLNTDLPASCFPNENVSENKWGWTNGALEPGEYTWPMYAGAGKCILSKGIIVGSLHVDFYLDGSTYTADVTFDLSTTAYSISDFDFTNMLHLYVGNSSVPPSGNFAPGNFYVEGGSGYYTQALIAQDNDELTATYRVTGLPSAIWVIGHIGS